MAERCNWIVFRAHSGPYNEKEEDHPDFFGVFVTPELRSQPEELLAEVIKNRKLFLVEITDQRWADLDRDWGMNERLKSEMAQQGYGMALTKLQARTIPVD